MIHMLRWFSMTVWGVSRWGVAVCIFMPMLLIMTSLLVVDSTRKHGLLAGGWLVVTRGKQEHDLSQQKR